MSLESIKYERGCLKILDQLALPHASIYIQIQGTEDGWNAIRRMQVRGAPAIAVVGALSLAVELHKTEMNNKSGLVEFVKERMNYLTTARPTAVNISKAASVISTLAENLKNHGERVEDIKIKVIEHIEKMLEKDVHDNKKIGSYCADDIIAKHPEGKVAVLTHCNTGSLATAGYGTALGAVRSLHEKGRLDCCYFTETRPYNQGIRLTAYELLADRVPHTLICDNMVGALMKSRKIGAVIVGADRIVANGDTANKIGTYQLAVMAKHHDIPFYICAPLTSIDFDLPNGDEIVIEQRPPAEMTTVNGVTIAPEGVVSWNPAFDVTPAELITGIAVEHGVFHPSNLSQLPQTFGDSMKL